MLFKRTYLAVTPFAFVESVTYAVHRLIRCFVPKERA